MQAGSRQRIVLVALVMGLLPTVAAAADLRPSVECLPDDTVLVLRMPGLNAFVEEMRTRTRFGAVALSADRLAKAWPLLLESLGEDDGAESPNLEESLAKYGLGMDDVRACGAGDAGVGIVARRRDEGLPPLAMALAWLEPGAEPATRMVAAFQRLLEEAEAEGDVDAPRRMDLQLAGHEVVWAVLPLLGPDLAGIDADGEVDAERLAELRRELAARVRDEKLVQTGQMHMFMTTVGDRLLAGMTIPTGDTGPGLALRIEEGRAVLEARVAVDDAGPRDFDRESGTETARDVVERFLAAHAAGAGPSPADLLRRPGMQAALPDGTPLLEMALDPQALVTALAGDDAETRRRMEALGMGALGPIGLRAALDGDRLRQGAFVSLPAPRTGLAGILDQPCDAAEIPSFATAEAIDLTQISLDLGAAYRTVRDFAVAEGGEQAANMFTAAEMQAQGWLGLDLPAFLTGLGSRHWILSYPPEVEAALAAARGRDDDGPAEPATADRAALVWALEDDAPFTRVLPKLAALAQQEVVEEQGFRGIRLPNGPAVFLGRGHLVVALGADSLEKTLAGIRTPPAGAASLREGDVFRRVDGMLGLGPARMFSVGDATRSGGMLGELRQIAAGMTPEDVPDDQREFLAALQALVPTTAEMEGMFGVHGATMEAGEHGVAYRAAWEMPAP